MKRRLPVSLSLNVSDAEGEFDIFFFEKNLQGDIVAIYNSSGTKIGTYTYDAWGNFTVNINSSVSLERLIVSTYNPFRYRGYYYDTDTSLYYLESRYYNAQWGRFLNADGVSNLGINGDMQGFNLFAYCSNSPIMAIDPNGEFILSAFIAGAAIGFAIGFVSSAVVQYYQSDENWENVDFFEAAYDGVVGALNGALAATGIPTPFAIAGGAVLGGISSIGSDLLFNEGKINVQNAVANTLIGAVAGGIAGGGSEKTISKYLHSRQILNNTIANETKRAIPGQTHAMNKHIKSLVVSGLRYVFGNVPATISSKQLGE